jgi:hypothetical protein
MRTHSILAIVVAGVVPGAILSYSALASASSGHSEERGVQVTISFRQGSSLALWQSANHHRLILSVSTAGKADSYTEVRGLVAVEHQAVDGGLASVTRVRYDHASDLWSDLGKHFAVTPQSVTAALTHGASAPMPAVVSELATLATPYTNAVEVLGASYDEAVGAAHGKMVAAGPVVGAYRFAQGLRFSIGGRHPSGVVWQATYSKAPDRLGLGDDEIQVDTSPASGRAAAQLVAAYTTASGPRQTHGALQARELSAGTWLVPVGRSIVSVTGGDAVAVSAILSQIAR